MRRRGRLSGRCEAVTVQYRWAASADYVELGEVMFDAVRNGASLYTEAQRAAWVTEPRQGGEWASRLSAQSIAAACSNGMIAGFMSLDADGYLDFAYIRPQHQGTGIFRMLFSRLLELAKENSMPRIWTHASLMARPAFAAMGFETIREEMVSLNGQDFERFIMQLTLDI